MKFNYWIDDVGFVPRGIVKEIIGNPESGFTGFRRYTGGTPGAYAFIVFNRKTVQLDILSFSA